MGNTVAPCMCRKEAGAAAVKTTRGRRRPKNFVVAGPDAAPRPRRSAVTLTPTPRRQCDDVDVELEQQEEESAGAVSWAGGAAGKKAAAVVTVKIVLKRKDAEALVARLNAQAARERKARMDELKGEFRAGEWDDDDCGGASPMTPCRDAWKPRLAPIKEN